MNKQYQLKITDEFTTTVEVAGPATAKEVVVFSHGFGVGRDSRGMFIDIEQELMPDYLCVRFDYSQVLENGDTIIGSYEVMQKTIATVVEHVQAHYKPLTVHLIAHSLGGLVASSVFSQFDGYKILLAPSITPVSQRLQEYFTQKPGTLIEANGDIIAERSDSARTHIAASFFTELQSYIPLDQYAQVTGDLYVLQAKQDTVIENRPELIKELDRVIFSEIDGDHNFEEKARAQLVQYIRDIFYGE